jgi:hypothetical protein
MPTTRNNYGLFSRRARYDDIVHRDAAAAVLAVVHMIDGEEEDKEET